MRGLPDIYVRLPTQSRIYIAIYTTSYVCSYKDCFLKQSDMHILYKLPYIVKYHGNKINRAKVHKNVYKLRNIS